MPTKPWNVKAAAYTWNNGKPDEHHGIAIVTRNNGHARAFIASRQDAIKLAQQIVALIDNPNTWENTNPTK